MRSGLIDEPPVLALPSLVRAIGLRNAVVLQQIHYREIHEERSGLLGTRRQIADDTGLSVRQVKRSCEQLADAGLVEVHAVDGVVGNPEHAYSINREIVATALGTERSSIPENVDSALGTVSASTSELETERSSTQDQTVPPTPLPEDVPTVREPSSTANGRREYTTAFEAFWKDYSRKGNKFAAAKKWKQLSPDDRRAAHAAVPRYMRDHPDPQFRKDAERFLSNRVWDNYEDVDATALARSEPVGIDEVRKQMEGILG